MRKRKWSKEGDTNRGFPSPAQFLAKKALVTVTQVVQGSNCQIVQETGQFGVSRTETLEARPGQTVYQKNRNVSRAQKCESQFDTSTRGQPSASSFG